MDTNRVCFSCFSEHDGNGPCPNCGFDLSKVKHPYIALPIGTILNGRYLTGRVLGVGGFGVTYVAFDMTLEICVAVKEFLPSGLAFREDDHYTMTVKAPEDQEKFDVGVSKFLEEARLLAKLHDVPNIVTVHDYFRENNTAYFVMEYIEGVDLMKYTQMHGGKLSFDEALRLVLPIIDSLAHVHAHNLLHRDISPDNIVVMKNGSTRLLDFGAARLAVDSTKSKSIILKHGFAPEEQYRKRGNQGPWSDEYALAATMYLIITGEMPPDAFERVHEDTLKSPIELGIEMPQYANDALMKAMAVKASERFPDMSSFSVAITGHSVDEIVPIATPTSVLQGSEQDELMVQGTTVNIETEEIPAQNITSQTNAGPDQSPSEEENERVLSPSVLNPSEVPSVSNPSDEPVPVAVPKVEKKSIWKRPLTYILAGIIVLAAIAVPTSIYISKNYTWGEPEKTTRTKRTKKTSETEPVIMYPDPSMREENGEIVYVDDERQISMQVPADYQFENNEGHYKFAKENGSVVVYLDQMMYCNDMRVMSLLDFVAQDNEIIQEYLTEKFGEGDDAYSYDAFDILLYNKRCALRYYINCASSNRSILLDVCESVEENCVYIVCGCVEDLSESGTEMDEIYHICESLQEDSTATSDFNFYTSDSPNNINFIYRASDVESIDEKTFMDGFYSLEIKLSDMYSSNSKLYVINLGFCDSAMEACQAVEQNIGTVYKVGGYQSVTPLARNDIETRVRNYTLSLRDDSNVTLDSTVCILNMRGEYFAVVATCDSDMDIEKLTLEFTMIVKSFWQT